ncbi:MAG: glycosyltransferase [Bacteroidales bacterium]|nr:glycosyltransferase [Bacteroidales bacterium]MCF8405610.1 glycosyltransferase [Bacteroidales bacterium]
MTSFTVPKSIKKHFFGYQSFDEIPESVFKEISAKCKEIHSKPPLVSIVAIAYNEEQNVLRCISSLAAQKTKIPYEIIIVNNNSTDNTQDIIDKCNVFSVIETNKGPGFARQAGMNVARGRFHLTADADSVYPATYVQSMYKKLNKKNIIGVFGTYSFIPEQNRTRFEFACYEMFRNIAVRLRSIKRPELVIGGACFGFQTDLGRLEGWRTDIKRGEDGSMLSNLKKYGKVKFSQSNKIKVWTSARTIIQDGNFMEMAKLRIKREFARIHEYFYRPQKVYANKEDNLL